MKQTLKALGLIFGVLAILLAVYAVWYGRSSGAFLRASNLRIAEPALAVRDARALVDRFRASAPADVREQLLRGEELPASLRLPQLRHARVFRDHLNLILGGNPDCSVGARVWSADSTTPHADEATAYPGVFFFCYCHDLPISPKNLP